MSVARGIILAGVVLPGTEWCLRDSDAWWKPGDLGTREREAMPDVLVGHWTAGPPRDGPTAGPKLVRAMKARKSEKTGKPLDVGVHFVIGWDGLVWQCADLAIATVHIGNRGLIRRSVGVECCWPGTIAQAKALGVDGRSMRLRVDGRMLEVLAPSREIVLTWERLAETLAAHLPIPRQSPMDRDGRPMLDRMTPKQARNWRGAMEHLHVPGSTKLDAAGLLAFGWPGAQV